MIARSIAAMRIALSLALVLVACGSPAPAEPPPATTAVPAPPTEVPGEGPPEAPEDEAATDDVVLAHHDDVETCALAAHASAPSLAGDVSVEWTVAASGIVGDVTLTQSSLRSDGSADGGEPARTLERCITAVIRTWTYPAIEATHTATARHTFHVDAGALPSSAVGVGVSRGEIGHGSEGGGNAGLVRFEPAAVSPGLAPEIVRRILMRHVAETRACYERALVYTPSLHGRLVAHFEIDAAGATQAPTISDVAFVADGAPDGGEPARTTAACIATAIDRWGFPAPTSAPVSVSVPLDLTLRPPPPPGGTIGLGDIGTIGS